MNVNVIWVSSCSSVPALRGHFKLICQAVCGAGLKWRVYHLALISEAYSNGGFPPSVSSSDWAETLFDQQMYVCVRISFSRLPPRGVYRAARRPRATVGEVNKMSEEMLSFIVSIMHNTPAL